MTNANLVADELHETGFRTKVFTSNGVIVSLTNRKVGRIEVETALDQIFDGLQLNCQSISEGVLVTW